jgi:neutral ceramidase
MRQLMFQLRAGSSAVQITPPLGEPMAGYGARVGVSAGVQDPLYARALVLDDGTTRLGIVICDLVGVTAELSERARARATALTGIPPENLIVGATHTHAGPDYFRSASDGELLAVMARTIGGEIAAAAARSEPVQLKAGEALVTSVSQNRRHPDWPIDPALKILSADRPDGTTAAALVNFACHATVMNADNLLLSGDYPGATVRALQRLLGDVGAVFVNGACGNVNPTWTAQRFPEVERMGRILGGEAGRLISELQPLGRGLFAANIRWNENTPKPVTAGELLENVRLRSAGRSVRLPMKAWLADEEYERRVAAARRAAEALSAASQLEEKREQMAVITHLDMERRIARRHQGTGGWREAEIQAFGLAPGCAILALPGEFFVETAREIAQRSGLRRLFISCYSNDYIGYVAPPPAFDEGGYEAGATPFGPDAEQTVVDAAVELLHSL